MHNHLPPFVLQPLDFLDHLFERYAEEEESVPLCRDFDRSKLQESWSWRNVDSARKLAHQILDDQGDIDRNALFSAITLLEKNLYSLGPQRHHDSERHRHQLNILHLFYGEKEGGYALRRITKPINNPVADKLIRETLLLPLRLPITDRDTRQAALSALLTALRQNVGSCFATAPAILVHQEQPLRFLADIAQLFGTGRLTRVIEGVEQVVPLSVSWGGADLLRPITFSSLGDDPLEALSHSPGLQAAFLAAGLLSKNRVQECREILKSTQILSSNATPFSSVFPGQIIKTVLLRHFSITEEDLETYHTKSIQTPFTEVWVQPSAHSGKGAGCAQYMHAYGAAVAAFKAMSDNALLKAWEFTLASLSESQANFAKWNFFISLGFKPEEPHGIGQAFYDEIHKMLADVNEELTKAQSQYDHLFAQAKYLEGRISHVATEREASWAQAEYQIRRHEINRTLSERDALYEKGRRLQGLFTHLVEFYGLKMRAYFQEVYDAEMHDVTQSLYDDSPAGFRLMYKHGRSNPAVWTMIQTASEYTHYLASFFVATEIESGQLPQFEGLEKEISQLVSTALYVIKTPEFLESSLYRLAAAYHEPLIPNPLQRLEQVKRKPWVYVSGGTMSTLVADYWGSGQPIKEEKKWVESENELLAFLIDTLKSSPLNVQRGYSKEPFRSMLAFSPTHAFLVKPGWPLFCQAWESELYTYTWIRDQWLGVQKKFLDSLLLDTRMMEAITLQFVQSFPSGWRPLVQQVLSRFSYPMSPPDFREYVLNTLSYEKWLKGGNRLQFIADELDALLYRLLPLFPDHQIEEKLELLYGTVDEIDPHLKGELMQQFDALKRDAGRYKMVSAEDLLNISKGFLIKNLKRTRSPIFYHQKLLDTMQKLGFCFPAPLLFADTNWVNNAFGFTLNPGTAVLELWRFDFCGGNGRPISVWKEHLNGKSQQEWGLYTAPHQYA